MHTRSFFRAFFCLAGVVFLSLVSVAAGAEKNPAPAGADFPADYAPQAGDFDDAQPEGYFMGIAQLRGRVLKERQGSRFIYVVKAPADAIPGRPLMAGDIIVGIGGREMRDDPIGLFKRRLERAQNEPGFQSGILRWRKGRVESVAIKFAGPVIPDLTLGGEHDPEKISWNLGASGAMGWTWAIPHITTRGAKQIYVTRVEAGSPADGVLKAGDVILGSYGKSFSDDARKEIAAALREAETPEKAGKLDLTVWYAGRTRTATLALKVMGRSGDTAPFDCAKSKRIADEACDYLLKHGLGNEEIVADVNALGLLATGREDALPMVREHARKIAEQGRDLAFKQNMESWRWGYHNIFLCEYYMATGDKSVLPAITEFSTKIALGQSKVGNWGHAMCVPIPSTEGPVLGVTPGYGALNQAGLACMISLALPKKAGVESQPITLALQRGSAFFGFYSQKGAIPYGDHTPGVDVHDDNGKDSAAAVLFDLLGDQEAATFFTKMTLASHNEREPGHTGNYLSFLWGALGAARGGDAAASAFMKKIDWFHQLERRRAGNFVYLGKPGMTDSNNSEHCYKDWDTTGARLLAYSLPLKKLHITGKGRSIRDIAGRELDDALEAGDLTAKQYATLTTPELLARLESWSPTVRHRAALALEKKTDNVVPQLIAMLDSENRFARYGACQGLRFAGRASEPAADALVAKGLGSSDPNMRFFAMWAFSSPNREMGLSAVAGRALPAMLQLAGTPDPADPYRRLKHELAYRLFDPRTGFKINPVARSSGRSTQDQEVLISAVRELLKLDDGGARSIVSTIYDKLTEDELKVLWKDIYQAVREIARCNSMFASEVRLGGLKLMIQHRSQEGLETAVWYLTNQHLHGSRERNHQVLKMVVETYGGHAKAMIPQLEQAAKYMEAGEGTHSIEDSRKKAVEVRQFIEQIRAAPTPDWRMTSLSQYLK